MHDEWRLETPAQGLPPAATLKKMAKAKYTFEQLQTILSSSVCQASPALRQIYEKKLKRLQPTNTLPPTAQPSADRASEHFRVEGYWTGPFIGRLLEHNPVTGTTILEVVDPLRAVPSEICPFPGCSLAIDHDGDHEKTETLMRAGQQLTIPRLACVTFIQVESEELRQPTFPLDPTLAKGKTER
jgi:hypothetical protein